MIVVVSGLPRSGTSLMMQMLAAGGLPVLTDGLRPPDEDNPRRYWEWEPIRRLAREPGLLAEAEGKAVKIISSHLMALPLDRDYRLLFMRRPVEEVIASQSAMLRRRGATTPVLPAMRRALEAHQKQVETWLKIHPQLPTQWVEYHALLWNARPQAEAIQRLLGLALDTEAMTQQVELALYRQRCGH